MTRLWSDGFDFYATGTDVALRYSTFASAEIVAPSYTAFNLGQALEGFVASRTWETATNETTWYFSIRLKYGSPATPNTSAPTILTALDGTTVQCSIVWDAEDSSISVYSGTVQSGTLIQKYTGLFQLNVWNSYQGKVVIDGSAGSVTIRKDGASTSLFTPITAANTRGPVSSHNYSTGMGLNVTAAWWIDDIWFNNDDTTAPDGWPPDIRAVMQYPAAATSSADFTPNQNPFIYGQFVNTFTATFPANALVGMLITTLCEGSVTDFTISLATSLSGHMIGAIYDATGANGTPGTRTCRD